MRIRTIAAIIVNWHRWELTLQCIQSLKQVQAAMPDVTLHVVVVDNETTGLPMTIPRGVAVIPVRENLGYGAGNNLGAAEALKLTPKPDAIFILNNDATIDAASLRALMATLDADPEVAIAAPVLTSPTGEVESAGGRFAPQRQWLTDVDKASPVDFVSGAAFLIRREAWLEVGGFDVRYFHYVEDLDLGWQLTKAGWKLIVVPEATVVHLKSQSSTSESAIAPLAYYTVRNQLLFWRKERTFQVIGANVMVRMGRNLLPIRHLLRGDFHTLKWVWRGLWDGLTGKQGRVN